MKGLLVTRLLGQGSAYHRQTRVFGLVEIRHQCSDLAAERDALAVSRRAFDEQAPEPDLTMRMVTLVDTIFSHEAETVAEERFGEVLDVISHEAPLSRQALMEAGCITALHTGHVEPRQPRPNRGSQGVHLRVRREWFEQIHFEQWLLASEPTDLSTRLRRSYHWSRKAMTETNRQLRVLFRWFAMETIWTLTRNDDIRPRILWSLGFPTGSMATALSRAFTQRLVKGHPAYRHWRATVGDRLRQVKDFRNNSVHSGFRQQDVGPDTLRGFDHLTMLACPRVQRTAADGMRAGLRTTKELFESLPVLFEANPYAIDDVHGTVIFSLEDPSRF